MSSVVDLYEGKYLYTLPQMPSDEKEIIGFDIKKKKDQYWTTPQFPDEFDWSMMSKREQFEIVDRERYRVENGVWFFNHGEPTYITGMHYDHLVNATFDFGKCFYTDSHRLDFYFRDYVRRDPMCYGQCTIKPRRYGYSLQEITQQTNEAMRDFSRLLGMMSNNKDKTYETLFDPLVASYLARPEWVRPDIYMPNEKVPKMKLLWHSGKVKKKKGDFRYDNRGNLNSKLIPKPTTVMGYDGWKLHYLTMDEAWKWTLANPYDCWKKQRPTLAVGGKIVGKASILSTMGDDDDYEEAIASGIEMFFDSDPTERDGNGHTKTGLYHRFISGELSLFEFMDVYGYVNMDQAANFIENGRKQYEEGSKEWIFEVRRYPRTLEEATSTASGVGIFGNKRVESAITILKANPPVTFIGRLEQLPNKKIIFEPDKQKGKWEFASLPVINRDNDYSNRWIIDPVEGTYQLRENWQGALGYDPIRYAEQDTTSKNLSMAAIVGFQKLDYYGNFGANSINCLYHDRPSDAEVAHYECFKASLFLGFPVAVERQVESAKRRFAELNASSLMLNSHYDGKVGFWQGKTSIKDEIDLIVAHWALPKTLDDKDYMKACKILRVLEQAKKFSVAKITVFDIIVALMKAMSGVLQVRPVSINDKQEDVINQILNQIQPVRDNTWKNQQTNQDLVMGGRSERG